MIKHVVLMKFVDASNAPDTKARLEALVEQIPEILSMEVGLDEVHTPASYDLALTTTHESLESLRSYQSHPAHEQFGQWLQPLLADRAVVDALIR